LIALQRALEGKHAPAPATFDPSVRTEDRPRSIWKAVYLALGVMIVVGLILTLVVPEFRDALQGLFGKIARVMLGQLKAAESKRAARSGSCYYLSVHRIDRSWPTVI
jgi:hypothetical protein